MPKQKQIDSPSLVVGIKGLIVFYSRYLSPPSSFKRLLCEKQRRFARAITPELWVLGWFTCLLILSMMGTRNLFLMYFFVYLLADMLLYHLYSLTVPSEGFFDGFRSVFLAIINYFEIIFIFSIYYFRFGVPRGDSLYLSVATITSLGADSAKYSNVPQWLFASEAIIGVFFIALVIAKFINISVKK